ncbi:MAG TPA: flavin reductase family protein [Acidimicrobiales bacterium]|nr:flavin reductase family protein [Acidimicrobiales bacterium]
MTADRPPKVNVRTEDPFSTPPGERRVDRRLRGRLVAPVTVWTAGTPERLAGLTVSSVLVAEGEPPHLLGLLDPLSELVELATATSTFTVHVLAEADRRLAAAFAAEYPGDPFDGLEVAETRHGPKLLIGRTVAACRLAETAPVGYSLLVTGVIEEVEIAREGAPLARYRGGYRTLAG